MNATASIGGVTTSDGCRIEVCVDGDSSTPVVVLSNSLGTDLSMWAPQVAALSGAYCVLRYDSRGHGASDAPAGPYSIERLARDVLDVLDAFGVGRARFCGVSMGGMVGQWLGANAPARIERLVLANTAAYMGPPSAWQSRIDTVHQDGMAAVVDGVVDRWFTPAFVGANAELVAGVRKTFVSTSPEGYTACCAAIRDMDLRPTMSAISPPTLLIAGGADRATPPECADELAGAMPRPPEIVTLPAAHLSNLEQPAGFNQAILRFFA